VQVCLWCRHLMRIQWRSSLASLSSSIHSSISNHTSCPSGSVPTSYATTFLFTMSLNRQKPSMCHLSKLSIVYPHMYYLSPVFDLNSESHRGLGLGHPEVESLSKTTYSCNAVAPPHTSPVFKAVTHCVKAG